MNGESWHIPVALILPFLSIQSQNIYIFYIIMMMMSAFVDIHTEGNSMELVLFFYFYVNSDDQI